MTKRMRNARCGKGRKHWTSGVRRFVLLAAPLIAGVAGAGIPEPDIIYYGIVSIGGVPQGSTTDHTIQFKRDERLLASYRLGELDEAGDFYVLRVSIESPVGGPISEGAAQLGDEATLWVNDIQVARVHLGARGRVTRMDVTGYASAAEVPDSDGDGVPDFEDICWLSASQVDSDGNGIGDACEGSLNPGLHYTDAIVAGGSGGAGNDPDPQTGKGAVDYVFSVSQTEVTNADYMAFLNAVAPEDPGSLYSEAMGADPRGGIVREGQSGSYHYKVKPNMANKPVNFVSWLDAARYANWLQNDQPTGNQDASTTEDGAFDLTVEDPGVNAVLDEGANQSLPTEDEWYKAAYYRPDDDTYRSYPTDSDTPPTPATANQLGDVINPGDNVANYDTGASWGGQTGHVTTAGGPEALSPSGTYDQGGNVAEWLADDAESGKRIARGGSYRDSASELASDTDPLPLDPGYEGPDVGFRTLMIPEPESTLLACAALCTLGGLWMWRTRRPRPEPRRAQSEEVRS